MLEATILLPWGKNFISLSCRIPGSAPARRDVLPALQLYLHNPSEPARGIPASPRWPRTGEHGPTALRCATSSSGFVFCTNANAALSGRCHLGPLIAFPGLGSTLPSQHDPAFQAASPLRTTTRGKEDNLCFCAALKSTKAAWKVFFSAPLTFSLYCFSPVLEPSCWIFSLGSYRDFLRKKERAFMPGQPAMKDSCNAFSGFLLQLPDRLIFASAPALGSVW